MSIYEILFFVFGGAFCVLLAFSAALDTPYEKLTTFLGVLFVSSMLVAVIGVMAVLINLAFISPAKITFIEPASILARYEVMGQYNLVYRKFDGTDQTLTFSDYNSVTALKEDRAKLYRTTRYQNNSFGPNEESESFKLEIE